MKSEIRKFAAAALVIAVVLIGINQFGGKHDTVSAQILAQIDKAKTITWKTTFYSKVTSRDGKRTWIETETRQCAYKAPGLYREIELDEKGKIDFVNIADAVHMQELELIPASKEATLFEPAVAGRDPRGPFVWVKEEMKEHNLEWVGERQTEAGQVNIFRTAFLDKANNRDWSYDFWIDAKTKKLVAIQVPGADIYDPEQDQAGANPPEKEWSIMRPMCSIQHDISFDVNLEDSLFSLEPPEGYALEIKHRAQVTEEEMVVYLGILADFNDRTFPDQVFPFAFTSDRLNKIWDKPKKDRTAAEQKLLETEDYYKQAGLNAMPTGHFVHDSTVEGSFRYLGKGVKLGDKERIVCWYRLKGSNTYRAVYGDLSIKDTAPEDLPLSVEPSCN